VMYSLMLLDSFPDNFLRYPYRSLTLLEMPSASLQFTLSTVDADDAEPLVRKCDFPAMRDDPLHLL
jgi:hypothetical protein